MRETLFLLCPFLILLLSSSVQASITIGINVHFTINGVDKTFSQPHTFTTVYRDSDGVWWFDGHTFEYYDQSSSGVYTLTVFVATNFLPASNAKVEINGENKTTDLLGKSIWELPYGSYVIRAFYQGKNQTQTIQLNGDRTIGFNFLSDPINAPNLLSSFSILIVVLALASGFIFFTKRRRK